MLLNKNKHITESLPNSKTAVRTFLCITFWMWMSVKVEAMVVLPYWALFVWFRAEADSESEKSEKKKNWFDKELCVTSFSLLNNSSRNSPIVSNKLLGGHHLCVLHKCDVVVSSSYHLPVSLFLFAHVWVLSALCNDGKNAVCKSLWTR